MTYVVGPMEKSVLRRYPRPVVHMRSQIESKRFGLIFGAGISKPLGFPNWRELVDRIAEDPAVSGRSLMTVANRFSETAKTQMLFQHFKSRFIENTREPYSFKLEKKIQGEWRRAIQRAKGRCTKTWSRNLAVIHF